MTKRAGGFHRGGKAVVREKDSALPAELAGVRRILEFRLGPATSSSFTARAHARVVRPR